MERSDREEIRKMQNPGEINPDLAFAPFTACDLPIDDEGRIYHLQITPEQFAPDILLVGDPGRAEFIGANLMRDLEVQHEHRGLVTVTGTAEITGEQATIISPVRNTVSTSGMGTPSLEIIINELVALNEIDFDSRKRKPDFPRLNVIRLGSSGALQESTKLDTPIITTYAIGMDNTGLFYEAPYPDETCKRLEDEIGQMVSRAMSRSSRFYGNIHPYVSRAEPNLVSALLEASESIGVATKTGLTVSCPGFFVPQGRMVSRFKSNLPDLDIIFSEYDPGLDGQRVENMEMESSFLLHFLGGLGHWGASICPAIANRRLDTFSSHYQDAMLHSGEVALLALATLRNRYPDVRLS